VIEHVVMLRSGVNRISLDYSGGILANISNKIKFHFLTVVVSILGPLGMWSSVLW